MFQKSSNILIYGIHPVIAALRNPKRQCKKLYTTKIIWQEVQKKIPKLNIQVSFLEPQQFNTNFKGLQNHQNIVLEALTLGSYDIEDIVNSTKKESSLVVILDQITDPHNIGAIIRSALAFSATAIIVPENNCPKENGTILKSASGAYEMIPIVRATNLASCMKSLKKAGYWIVGLDGNGNEELNSKIFSAKTVIVLGSEETGMRKLTRENCDFLAKIPISSNLESLNVSNAAAISFYEFAKYTK